jgi:Family of unknown function (DUF5681)
MTDSSDNSNTDPPSRARPSPNHFDIGYGKPPKHSQFPKGKSGHPSGRPKAPIGISIKKILDGDQHGKNGEVISRRDAVVIAIINGALRGNQKAFSKFMKLMNRAGLMRRETFNSPSVIHVPTRNMTKEEYDAHLASIGVAPQTSD